MQRYIDAISSEVKEVMRYWSSSDVREAKEELQQWINERHKHSVIDYFDKNENCVFYTKQLYESRVRCFYEMLMQTDREPKIRKIMKNSNSIVSFGCGPGPEIAACISFLRESLPCKNHKFNVTAVDCLNSWRDFINVIEPLDDDINITFKNERVCVQYLLKMDHSDICIMSYPHAMNFEDIWLYLVRKFTLIIFIDQLKPKIRRIMTLHGFTKVDFEFNGDKSFFYRINDTVGFNTKSYLCKNVIDVQFSCGHLNKIYCYQDNLDVSLFKCRKTILKMCPRELHENGIVCGENKKCSVLVAIDLQCGHQKMTECGDFIVQKRLSQRCDVTMMKRCSRNMHDLVVLCGTRPSCNKTINIVRKCGHSFPIKCDQDEVDIIKSRKCSFMLNETCERNLHNVSFVCGSKKLCDQMIRVKRRCDHYATIRCCDDEYNTIYIERCMEMLTKTCSRDQHKYQISCAEYALNKNGFICKSLINVTRNCGHVASLQCFEDQTTADLGNCVVLTKVCHRKIHRKTAPCYSEELCKELFDYSLPCGHVRTIPCNNDTSKEEKCKVEVTVKCNKNIHNITKKCFETVKCDFERSIKLECGCRKIVTCDDIENKAATFVCKGDCKIGNCHQKDDENFINKLKNMFQFEYKMPHVQYQNWMSLLGSWLQSGPEQLQDVLQIIAYDIKKCRFTEECLERYKTLFTLIKSVLDFYQSILDDGISLTLPDYINKVHESILALIKWVTHEALSKTQFTSHYFREEFQRIKHYVSICRFIYLDENLRRNRNSESLYDLLDKLTTCKYTEDFEKELCSRVTMILIE